MYKKTGPNTYVAQWTQQWGTVTNDSETGMAVAMKGKLYVNANTSAAWPGETYTSGQAYLMLKIVAGDFDDGSGTGTPDGFVNQDDIDFMMANLGTGAGLFDFDGDGDEDSADVTFFKERILDLPPSGGPAGDIPEPVTMVLTGLALAGLGGYLCRRRTA